MAALKDVALCIPCDGNGWTCECIHPHGRWSGDMTTRGDRRSHLLHCSRRKKCEACDGAGLPKKKKANPADPPLEAAEKAGRAEDKRRDDALDAKEGVLGIRII